MDFQRIIGHRELLEIHRIFDAASISDALDQTVIFVGNPTRKPLMIEIKIASIVEILSLFLLLFLQTKPFTIFGIYLFWYLKYLSFSNLRFSLAKKLVFL